MQQILAESRGDVCLDDPGAIISAAGCNRSLAELLSVEVFLRGHEAELKRGRWVEPSRLTWREEEEEERELGQTINVNSRMTGISSKEPNAPSKSLVLPTAQEDPLAASKGPSYCFLLSDPQAMACS